MYDLFIALFALISLPRILWQRARGKKRFCTLAERFGVTPPVGPSNRRRIWLHAVSLGEVKSTQPLFRRLLEWDSEAFFLITVATMTGFEEARRLFPEAKVRFLPLDFSFLMRRWLRCYRPHLLLFIEGDIWPNLIRQAQCSGVKTALVSGKISERSTRRLKWASFLACRLFGSLDALCVQNEEYRQRFASLVERPIVVTGNLKLDVRTEPFNESLAREVLALAPGQVALTLSCTHAPEEKELLEKLLPLWQQLPNLVLLLAPRHPERFDEVAEILEKCPLSFCRLSQRRKDESIVLIDAMGQLPLCYAASALAIVAGSFSSHVGGHNVLEPLLQGCPVLFGPHMHQQQEFCRLAIASQAGWQVAQDQLAEVLLEKIAVAETLKDRAKQAGQAQRGSAERTFAEVVKL